MATNDANDPYRAVMTTAPPATSGKEDEARRNYLFAELWTRPGLGRRQRRWVTLVCVGFATDQQAGILNFVFGHVWMRPGLSRRDRRFVTVACVGVCQAPMPILAHVGSALHSGDITRVEMDELVLHFTAYAGSAQGDVRQQAVIDDGLGKMLAA